MVSPPSCIISTLSKSQRAYYYIFQDFAFLLPLKILPITRIKFISIIPTNIHL